jgi:hypothetical protein
LAKEKKFNLLFKAQQQQVIQILYCSQILVHGFFFLTPNIPIFFPERSAHFSGGRFWHPHISI